MKRFKTALLLLSILLISSGCSRLTPEELIISAKGNIEQGNMQSAVVELKNAISQDNTLSEARTLLGRVYLQQSQFEAAEKELLRGADMGAPYADVYPYLVKVYYYQEDFEGVIALADRIMLVLDDDIKPSLALYQYLAQLRVSGQGINQVGTPDILEGDKKRLAEAYRAYLLQNYEEAKSISEEFNAESSDKVEQYFLSGLINNRLGDLESSAANFNAALEEYPNYHLVRFLLIDVLLRNESLDSAEIEVDKLLSINKNQPQANYYKGAIAFQRKDFETAFLHAEKAREGRGEGLRNDMVHGLSAYKLEKYERAYASLRRAASKLPKSHSVHRLVAQLQLDLGYRREAAETLASLEELTDTDTLLFKQAATLFATESDFEMAAQQFQSMNKLVDNDALAELGEGVTKIAANDMTGIKNLQQSLLIDPSNDQAWLFLAEVHMQEGQHEKALKVAGEWKKVDEVAGLVLEGQIYGKMNELEKAVIALESALEIDEYNIASLNNLAKFRRQQGNYAQSMEIAFKALQNNPRNKYAAKELILAARGADEIDKASKFLDELMQSHSDIEEPVLMLATLKRINGENNEAIELLEENRSLLSVYGLESLGDAYYNAKQYKKAENVYLEWKDRKPNITFPWLRLVGLHAASGNIEKSRLIVEEAVEKFPNSEPLRLAKLRYHMQFKEYAAAREELAFLQKSTSTNKTLNKFDGQLALIDGEFERAVPLLAEYYNETGDFDDAVNLAIAYVGADQKGKAKAIFEKSLQAEPNSLGVKMKAAEFMSINGYDQDAIKLYEEIASALPKSPIGHNNLSAVYLRTGQIDMALASAEKAIAIAPDIPQVMDTYGWALFKKGNALEAKSILAVAHNKTPEDTDIALNYAEVLISLNESAEAKSVLSSARATAAKQEIRLKSLKQAAGQ